MESSPNVGNFAFRGSISKGSPAQDSFETPTALQRKKTQTDLNKDDGKQITPIKLKESTKLESIDEEQQSMQSKGLSSRLGRGISSKFNAKKTGVMNNLMPTILEKNND